MGIFKQRALSKNRKSEYELYLNNLLKTVKKQGILVERMKPGTSFSFDIPERHYKKELGAVPVENIFGTISNVYLVYEDFDGTIKYYDYPQRSRLQAYICLHRK